MLPINPTPLQVIRYSDKLIDADKPLSPEATLAFVEDTLGAASIVRLWIQQGRGLAEIADALDRVAIVLNNYSVFRGEM